MIHTNVFNLASEKIILGIDPGTTIMGYGIIQVVGKKVELLTLGVIHMEKLPSQGAKLRRIFERTLGLIDEFHPDEVALEAPFFGKNVQSMLKLGRAQGVAMAAAVYRDLPIFEYAPRKIKQSITGNGTASKEQVSAMLQSILKINSNDMPQKLDATDGLAAALCHYFQGDTKIKSSSYSGWESFVKNNPNKIKGNS
jgi:crossover junction endodeoxyribonuclease RuvC